MLMAVAYQLYTVDNDKLDLVEEATEVRPFQFITGFGIALEAFENAVGRLAQGESFEFTLTPDNAYGQHEDDRVLDLDREMFCINGHFDHEHIRVGATVPLQNEDGNHFIGQVLEIGDEKVRMDLNHPLAGKTLKFKGHVVDSREATNDEIQHFINMLNGEHCCCGEDGCGCGEDDKGKGGHGGCGHHHHGHDGCGCHNH